MNEVSLSELEFEIVSKKQLLNKFLLKDYDKYYIPFISDEQKKNILNNNITYSIFDKDELCTYIGSPPKVIINNVLTKEQKEAIKNMSLEDKILLIRRYSKEISKEADRVTSMIKTIYYTITESESYREMSKIQKNILHFKYDNLYKRYLSKSMTFDKCFMDLGKKDLNLYEKIIKNDEFIDLLSSIESKSEKNVSNPGVNNG